MPKPTPKKPKTKFVTLEIQTEKSNEALKNVGNLLLTDGTLIPLVKRSQLSGYQNAIVQVQVNSTGK